MPVMTPAVMAGVGLAGGAIGAVGKYQSGQDAAKAQRYNANLNDMQAMQVQQSAQQESQFIQQNAVLNEYRQRKQLSYQMGRQTAAYAGSGVSVGTGSPLKVMVDDLANAELEIAIGQWNAKADSTRALNLGKQQSSQLRSSGEMMRRKGESQQRAGMWGAASTLLTSGSTAYSRFSKEKFNTRKTKVGEG